MATALETSGTTTVTGNVGVTGTAAVDASGHDLTVVPKANTPLNVAGPVCTVVSTVTVTPAGGAVLATTGPLAAGDYEILAWDVFVDDTGASAAVLATLEHRNAADNGNVAVLGAQGANYTSSNRTRSFPRMTVAQNERFRILNAATAGTTGKNYYGLIVYRRVG